MRRSHISQLTKAVLFLLLLPFQLIAQEEDLNDTTTIDSIQVVEEEPSSPFTGYFEPLSEQEAEAAFDGINTGGVIDKVENVPNNREVNDSRVSDPHNMLTAAGIDTLNRIMKMVEEETGFEMAVVCLNSIGDNDPHFFATDLFNYWGIGEKGKDNGLLVMVVHELRKVSTITGRGTEAIITDAETSEIHDNEMIPFFKKNDYTTGIIRGVQVIAEVLYGVPPDYLNYTYEYDDTDYSSSDSGYDDYDYSYYDNYPWYRRGLWGLYFSVLIIILIVYVIVLIAALITRNLHKRYHILKTFTLLVWPIIFPVPFLLLYFLNKKLMEKWRNTERFSSKTGEFMIKLCENEEDQHLEKGQISEELVKSIDYDVWITVDGSDVLVLRYKRWFSKYRKCPKCRYKTYYKEYDRVISAATYSSSGTGERKYSCTNCGHSKVKRYTIPRKQRSSSTSSSGSSWSSGSSGSSWGGSSSSGSSWGGGSSRGGGSTSGW
jgi:uncharacterized protein